MANHQLQTLRPYLVHTAAPFELKMFQENRQKGPLSLDATRRWLQAAFDELATHNTDPRPSPSVSSSFSRYPRHLQVQIAVVKAIVDLVFDSPSSFPSPPSSPPSSPQVSSTSRQAYPETLYLDHIRLTTLRNDAADFATLYMLLMLYRQLVHSGSTQQVSSKVTLSPDDFLALKKEIWEIGPARLGLCFTCKPPTGLANYPGGVEKAAQMESWRRDMDDVVLQLTTRACEVRSRAFKVPSPSPSSMSTDQQRPLPSTAPDSSLLKLATSWTDSHLRADSPLSALMRKRVKHAVQDLAVQIVLPNLAMFKMPGEAQAPALDEAAARNASGLEPLMPEIRHLAEKLSKLVTVHLNVYSTLYTQPGFVTDHTSATPSVRTVAPSSQ